MCLLSIKIARGVLKRAVSRKKQESDVASHIFYDVYENYKPSSALAERG